MSDEDDSEAAPPGEKWIDAEDAVQIASAQEQRGETTEGEDADTARLMREPGPGVDFDPNEDSSTSTGSGATSGGST